MVCSETELRWNQVERAPKSKGKSCNVEGWATHDHWASLSDPEGPGTEAGWGPGVVRCCKARKGWEEDGKSANTTAASKRISPAWSTFQYPKLLQTLSNLALGHFQGSQGSHSCSRQSAPISPAVYPVFCIFTDWLFPQEKICFKQWNTGQWAQHYSPWPPEQPVGPRADLSTANHVFWGGMREWNSEEEEGLHIIMFTVTMQKHN